LQILICLVKLFDFLSLFIVFVLFFFSTVLVNKDEYIYITVMYQVSGGTCPRNW